MDKAGKVSLISGAVVFGLMSLKMSIAFLTGSIALKADAIHSLTDFISTLAVFIGLKLSKRKSRNFPYGLYKIENLVALVVAFFIFWAGYEIIKEVVLAQTSVVKKLPLALAIAALSGGVSYFLSLYKIKAGQHINSPSLQADGYHSRADALSSLIVFLGLSGHFLHWNIEKYAAVIIVILIVRSGYGILVDSLKVLLDASLDYETLTSIRKVIEDEPKVQAVTHISGRQSGRYRFIEVEVTLRVKDVARAHQIVTSLEKKVKEKIPFVDSIIIHYEPVEKKVLKYAFPLTSTSGNISPHFGEAPYLAVLEVKKDEKQVVKKEILVNPFLNQEKGKGIALAEFLVDQDVDFVVLKEKYKGKGPEYVLAESAVTTIIIDSSILKEAMTELGIKELNEKRERQPN